MEPLFPSFLGAVSGHPESWTSLTHQEKSSTSRSVTEERNVAGKSARRRHEPKQSAEMCPSAQPVSPLLSRTEAVMKGRSAVRRSEGASIHREPEGEGEGEPPLEHGEVCAQICGCTLQFQEHVTQFPS